MGGGGGGVDEIATKISTWENRNLGVVTAVKSCCLIYIPLTQLMGRSYQGWCHVVTAVKSCDKQPVTCQAHLSSQGTCLTGHVWHMTVLDLSLYLLQREKEREREREKREREKREREREREEGEGEGERYAQAHAFILHVRYNINTLQFSCPGSF